MVEQDSAFRRIVEHQYTAVAVLDDQLRVEHINSSAELLFVRSQKQLLGQPFASLFEKNESILEVLNSAIEQGSSVSVRSAHWEFINKESLSLDFIVSPFLEDNQVSIIIEMLPANRANRISRDEGLIDQSETSRHLVRGLAHEIKNPLGGIRGAAQLLAGELPSEDLKEYTTVIIEEADRLRNLVDRLLGSHQLPEFVSINVHQVIERVLTLISAEAGDSIELVRDYDPSIPEIMGDEAQLIQVFLNIARNALQALTENRTSASSIRFKTRTIRQFTIRQRRHRLVARIDIIDNGPGIAEDLLEKIFYPMISGRANGTGLGLSFVQQFVQLHGGSVECQSEAACTQFSIYIPLEAVNV